MNAHAMVTKTRVKPPRSAVVKPISLSKKDRSIVLECLALENETEGVAQHAMETIEDLLRVCHHRISQIPDMPLAPHIIAALNPIVASGKALAAHLDPFTIQPAVLRGLGVSHDELFELRSTIEWVTTNAEEAIARHQKVEPDNPVAMTSHVLRTAETTLGELFDRFRVDAAGDDPVERAAARREFVKQCLTYLPRSPMHSHHQRARKRSSQRIA